MAARSAAAPSRRTAGSPRWSAARLAALHHQAAEPGALRTAPGPGLRHPLTERRQHTAVSRNCARAERRMATTASKASLACMRSDGDGWSSCAIARGARTVKALHTPPLLRVSVRQRARGSASEEHCRGGRVGGVGGGGGRALVTVEPSTVHQPSPSCPTPSHVLRASTALQRCRGSTTIQHYSALQYTSSTTPFFLEAGWEGGRTATADRPGQALGRGAGGERTSERRARTLRPFVAHGPDATSPGRHARSSFARIAGLSWPTQATTCRPRVKRCIILICWATSELAQL